MSDLTRDAFEVLSYDDINSVLEDQDKKVWVHIDDVREAIAHALSRGRAEATPATTDDVGVKRYGRKVKKGIFEFYEIGT